jgi:hypothetical protein
MKPDHGTAASAKRGRNPRFPFVPVIKYSERGSVKTRQIRGKAFATAGEAVAYAGQCIEAMKHRHTERLVDPRNRVLRDWYSA